MNNNYPAVTSTKITNSTENHYIVFSVQEKKYAINITNVVEVINIPTIEIPETMPEGVAGIFNYKGIITKVIDLCPFLGFTPKPFNINNQLIIMCIEGKFIAIHSDYIVNIEYINPDDIQGTPYNTDASILKNIYKAQNESINIIDVNQLNNLLNNTTQKTNTNYLELFPSDEKSVNILKLREEQTNTRAELFSFNFDENTQNQYVLFSLDNHNYYIDLKYVKEFSSTRRINITKLPYTQNYIKGIVNIKGEFLLVVDLQLFLNTKRINDIKYKQGKLIIVEGKNYDIAFFVDDIKYIENLNNINPLSYNNDISKYIYAEYMNNGELCGIINTEKIINDEKLYININ